MDENLLQEISNQLQKTNDLLQKSFLALKQKDEIIKHQSEELTTWNRIEKSDEWFDFKEVAKAINYKKMGRNTLLGFLRDHKIFMSDNEPYQQYVNAGYFKITIKYIDALDEVKKVPLASIKGIDYIRKLIDEDKNGTETN